MQAPTPPLQPPPGFSGPTVPATGYVLCYFLGPGVPWSEDHSGTDFQSWADTNLLSNKEQFCWLWSPGKQMMEFVTAQNTSPGHGPIREALSGLREASG